MTASQRLSSRWRRRPGSLTWKVSRATPSARVSICADRMLTPFAGERPRDQREQSSGVPGDDDEIRGSEVREVEHLGHGRFSRNRSISRRWAAMRWGDVVRT